MTPLGRRFLICLAVLLLILAIAVPLITYAYVANANKSVIASYISKERVLQQQVDSLAEQNKRLNQENLQLTNLTQPNLITSIGWYLHKSNDPVATSKNTFTIYGRIYNIGSLPANNAEISVKFLASNDTLLQVSTIHLGIIPSITNSTMPFDIGNRNIDCSVADSVTNVTISLHYQ